MLEYLERDTKAKKSAKTRAWYCVKCGASLKPDEAWIEDGDPLCHKHGMRHQMKRFANKTRRRRPLVNGSEG